MESISLIVGAGWQSSSGPMSVIADFANRCGSLKGPQEIGIQRALKAGDDPLPFNYSNLFIPQHGDVRLIGNINTSYLSSSSMARSHGARLTLLPRPTA